jgi:hypothetical protein
MDGRIATALALALAAVSACAATLEEDEARIEAMIRAERAGMATKPAVPLPLVAAQAPVPVPVAASVVAPPPTPHDDWLAAPPRTAGTPFAELANRVGQRVAITTAGERVHRGVVGSADARQVTLRVKRPGGTATYTLTRNQVLRVDVR